MPPPGPSSSSGSPQPRVVLLVEDSEDNREMYATFLTQSGFRVLQASTASQALREIARERPDLVVTDVITLTGLSLTPEEIQRALQAGSEVVLFKPCLPDTLLSEIRKALRRPPATAS
jgi:two-component system cell cycle response regulator DivK